uniref:RNA-directed RNA polymerase L n=1 Tax=Hymenopteran phenui-related virus OKIAV255 TaxID=2792547 RepID=A0A7T0M3E3_9VIRU|nr:RNA-dependent RNA polymerase [Hymenopteran phenui-related virus OKIAV255]
MNQAYSTVKEEVLLTVQATFPMLEPGHFYSHEAPIIQVGPTTDLRDFGPHITIERVAANPDVGPPRGGPDVYWSVADQYADHLSVTKGSTLEGPRYKYSHDLVSGALVTTSLPHTDQPLKLIKEMNDDWDNTTPDIIERHPNFWLVIEVVTTLSFSEESVLAAYRGKLFKYSQALEDRAAANRPIIFVVIAVGMEHVASTIELSKSTVRDLLLRRRLTKAIEELYLEEFDTPFRVDEATALEAWEKDQIQLEMTGFTFDDTKTSTGRPWLTKEYCEELIHDHRDRTELEAHVIQTFYSSMVSEAQKLNESSFCSDVQINAFASKFAPEGSNPDHKAIIILPAFLPQVDPTSTTDVAIRSLPSYQDAPVYYKLWSEAFQTILGSPEMFTECPELLMDEAMCDDPSQLEQLLEYRQPLRKKYHRVNFAGLISDDERVELAIKGVWGKAYKDHHAVLAEREKNQRAYSWNADTTDITAFINDVSLLDRYEGPENPSFDLLDQASRCSMNDDSGMQILKEFYNTKLGVYLDFMGDVMTEVCVSNKQNCSHRGMILKKLRNYHAYMLICPTSGSQHCFVSFFMPKGDKEGALIGASPFLRVYETDMGYFTNFTSFKPSKIENKATMLPAFFTLVSYWSWFYNHDMTVAKFQDPSNAESLRMLLLSLLLRIEDKESSEFVITQTRYMFMEIFRSDTNIKPPNPLKLLSKLNHLPRSRLTLWLTRQIVRNFKCMQDEIPVQLPPERLKDMPEDDSPPTDTWVGLLNPFTGGPITSGSRAIALAYTGYLKNKNEDAEGNTDFLMLDKIIEEEMSLKHVPKPMQYGLLADGEVPVPKGFDRRMLLHGSSIMKTRLRKQLGSQWQQIVMKDIRDKLSTRLSEDLATLKASCSVKHAEVASMTATLTSNLAAGRIRVLEAIYKEVDVFGINPYLSFSRILRDVEQHGGFIVADLFKKKQHGGLREIFVLNIYSRMIQLYVETISRVLCSYFEEETMTHPRNKIERIDNHRISVHEQARKRGSASVNYCNSMDKTRWSQSMMMTMLMVPLATILPASVVPGLQRCLNCWVGKKIRIPQAVINLMLQHHELTNSVFSDLKMAFIDPSSSTLTEKQADPFLTIYSGMMQGILHYTSSLLHVCFLNSMQVVIPSVIKSVFPTVEVVLTQVCSSDDSSCILSVLDELHADKPTMSFRRACALAMMCLTNMGPFSKYYGLKDSVKSVEALVGIIEFNSEFVFNDTIAIPVIKFLAACLSVAESSSLMKRQLQMYNLLSDLYRSGFPSLNTHVCQLAQGVLHYKMMGCGLNSLFPEYADRLTRLPDPIYGFFLIDSQYFPGVMGLSFSHWMLARRTNILRFTPKAVLQHELEVTPEGGVMRTLTIKMGQSRRWKQTIDTLRGHIDLQDQVNHCPDLLFREARNNLELKIKLLLKATMPAVAESMMRGNPFMMALASSVYAISTHCYSKTSLVMDAMKLTKEERKTCMILELDQRLADLAMQAATEQMDFKMVFPCEDRYKEAVQVIKELKSHTLVGYHRLRQRRSYFSIQPTRVDVGITLKQYCQNVWFGENLIQTRTTIQRAKDYYTDRISWLRPTLRETLAASPFTTYQELAGFVESYTIKPRNFMRYGPKAAGRGLKLKLLNLARKSYQNLKLFTNLKKTDFRARDVELAHKVNLATTLPDPTLRENTVRCLLKSHEDLASTTNDLLSLNHRDRKLALCQMVAKGNISHGEILTMALASNAGIFISYPKPQTLEVVEGSQSRAWKGYGTIRVQYAGMIVNLYVKDDKCTEIVVSNWSTLHRNPCTLKYIFKTLNVSPCDRRTTPHTVAKFDGSTFVTKSSQGTRIREDPSLRVPPVHCAELCLSVDFLNIHLSQIVGVDYHMRPKSCIILSWRHSASEVLMNMTNEVTDDPWHAWMNQSKLSIESCIDILVEIENRVLPDFVSKWYLDVLYARLVGLLSLKANFRTSAWTNIEEMEDPNPNLLNLQGLEEAVGSVFQLFDQDAMRHLIGVVDKTLESLNVNISEDVRAIMMMPTVIEPLDTRRVGDFKRRMPMFDELIIDQEATTPAFWEQVFSGVMPKANREMADLFMRLYHVPLRSNPSASSSLLVQARERIKDRTRKTEAPEDVPDQIMDTVSLRAQDIHAQVKISDLEKMPSSVYLGDDVSLLDPELLVLEETEGVEFTLESLLAADLAFDESPVNTDEVLADCHTVLEALNRKLSALQDYTRSPVDEYLRWLDFNYPYLESDNCGERVSSLEFTFVPSVHNGNCGFEAFKNSLGLAVTPEELRSSLSLSPWYRLVTSDEAKAIMATDRAHLDDVCLLMLARMHSVNICLHHSIGPFSRITKGYYHLCINTSYPWVHLSWYSAPYSGGSMYDALVIEGKSIERRDDHRAEDEVSRPYFRSKLDEYLPLIMDNKQEAEQAESQAWDTIVILSDINSLESEDMINKLSTLHTKFKAYVKTASEAMFTLTSLCKPS